MKVKKLMKKEQKHYQNELKELQIKLNNEFQIKESKKEKLNTIFTNTLNEIDQNYKKNICEIEKNYQNSEQNVLK